MSRRTARISGPTKGERTRQRIVERAATLFNLRGTAGASMGDVTEASGLEKGGVYNHFASKDELVLEAFDYAAGLVLGRIDAAAARAARPLDRLLALLDVYREVAQNPPLPGGCPLLNAAIEADDGEKPALRARVRRAFAAWHKRIADAVDGAVAADELEPIDAEAFASTAIATLEGGVMLSRLFRDPQYIKAAVDHLHQWLGERARRLPA
jgi:AcrR family transcriptional regulator